ncbi:zinc finger protein 239-like isoform X2 [Dendronephthya gigantea]|uniref:zinc finger protein 239-like isoform X2 n=1 Tax=Dendronephthya gigantea TaxID=151771 RepID=UPI0010691EF3|nr:zinc finger protein 239-like isoform X2 [Dendronephthya gigantea]
MGQEVSKPASYHADTDSLQRQKNVPESILKDNKSDQSETFNERNNDDGEEDIFANRTYDVIEPPLEEKEFSDLNVDIIEKEASQINEHIYESIDKVITKNTSSQTESFVELNENLAEAGNFVKVFKEISCQTETPESRRNKKRNSDTREEDMAAFGKTKESRLSSDSSTSTQDSHDSADSGHFGARNAGKSPRSPESPYLWQPEGLNHDEVKSFMNSLPRDKVPSAMNPEGVAHFNSQLAYQNPKQDSDPALCKSLNKDQEISLKCLYMNLLEARGTGFIKISESNENTCEGCGNIFKKNDMVVSTGQGLRHPSCFACTVCQQFLTKLIYYSDDNNRLFCGRHYAELFKPRCFDCDELIIAGKFVRAMNHTYHAEHFRCGKCEETIGEKRYTTEGNQAICLSCHTAHLADDCQACGKKITIGQKRMSHGSKNWHEECFICEKCRSNLVLGSFNISDEKVICGKCYQQTKSKMCCTCGEEIKAGSSLIEHDGLFYHSDCFCCKSCRQPIKSNFMENEGSFYCPSCHRNLFSEKCVQCGLAIVGDGVTYNNEVWHDSCFGCYNCQQPLSTRKFLIREGNRYCNCCYEDIFAKQCHSCCKKIKDGAYLTTNDLYWHSDCFKCTDCHKDLGHIGFHMVNEKTYCSDCPRSVFFH